MYSPSLWVRGGGSTAIGDFMSAVLPLGMLNDESSFITFEQLGTSRGMCRLLNYTSQCVSIARRRRRRGPDSRAEGAPTPGPW